MVFFPSLSPLVPVVMTLTEGRRFESCTLACTLTERVFKELLIQEVSDVINITILHVKIMAKY